MSGSQVETCGFVARLGSFGAAPALIAGDTELSYAELASRIEARAGQLMGERRLVLHRATNTLPAVIEYLAALHAGHVVLPVEVVIRASTRRNVELALPGQKRQARTALLRSA